MNGLENDNIVVSVKEKKTTERRNDREIDCLWATRLGGRVVGLVHLTGVERQTASISSFRVDPEYRHTAVLTNLIDRVRDYCRRRGCPVLQLELHVAPQWVLRQLEAHGLRLVRRTLSGGQDLLEFRLDPGPETARRAQRAPHQQRADADWPAVQGVMGELVAGTH